MKLTSVEKLLVCGPLRTWMLRRFEAPRVLSGLDVPKGSVCLDIGCGSGIGALLINQYLDCERIVGIDIDPGMVTLARKCMLHPSRWAQDIRTDNIEFRCEDATKSSFPDCHFDAVVEFGALHHIRGWKKAISEVYRILKEGGVFCFAEEVLLPAFLFRLVGGELLGGVSISENELRATLEKNGFSIQRFERALSMCFVRATKEPV